MRKMRPFPWVLGGFCDLWGGVVVDTYNHMENHRQNHNSVSSQFARSMSANSRSACLKLTDGAHPEVNDATARLAGEAMPVVLLVVDRKAGDVWSSWKGHNPVPLSDSSTYRPTNSNTLTAAFTRSGNRPFRPFRWHRNG